MAKSGRGKSTVAQIINVVHYTTLTNHCICIYAVTYSFLYCMLDEAVMKETLH